MTRKLNKLEYRKTMLNWKLLADTSFELRSKVALQNS